MGLLEPHVRHSGAVRVAVSQTLDDMKIAGQRVLLRADLNVPVRDGKVSDLTRLERLAPTIRELADKGARVIVLSHFDRPQGKIVPEMSLRPGRMGGNRSPWFGRSAHCGRQGIGCVSWHRPSTA